jgi:Holliday junction resolvase RusA-like endonuclease
MITFTVHGKPIQQGSKNGAVTKTGRVVIYETNDPPQKSWRRTLVEMAREHCRDGPLDGPLAVWIEFRMPRPQNNRRGHWASKKPDIDKLARNVLDALTDSGLIVDDARICRLNVEKTLSDPTDPWVGAVITVSELCEVR